MDCLFNMGIYFSGEMMQTGKVYYHGDDCECTRNGKHHYEDMEDDTLWCRMCGHYIDDKNIVKKIIEAANMSDPNLAP